MRKSVYLAGAAFLQAIALPAVAQDTSSEAASASDIIVTARRQEERLQDVPISITVLSQDAIAKRNIVNAGELGTYVPSLSTNANFGRVTSKDDSRRDIQLSLRFLF